MNLAQSIFGAVRSAPIAQLAVIAGLLAIFAMLILPIPPMMRSALEKILA